MMEEEIWKPVVGWEGLYEVSNMGRVRSLPRATTRGRILKANIQALHYPQVVLSRNGKIKTFEVHKLVMNAFVGPRPMGMEACHNNGDWNDCRLANLRWDTRKSNHADKRKHGTHNGGVRHYRAYFNAEEVARIRAEPGTVPEIARRYGVSRTCIDKIKNRKSYADL